MASLRLEKGYRDLGVDIDNTDNPVEAGLGFAVAFDKPGGFIGRDALLAIAGKQPLTSLMVSILVEDPEVDLFGNEQVRVDGIYNGYVRAAAFGHTLGGPVGLAQVTNPDGVTQEWLDSARMTVVTPKGTWPARASIAPFYDPNRSRILAADR
jgi:4-methylaminobutanoate oxidase (formaldehyde-forming)